MVDLVVTDLHKQIPQTLEAEFAKAFMLNMGNLATDVLRPVDTSAFHDLMDYHISILRATTIVVVIGIRPSCNWLLEGYGRVRRQTT